MREWFAVAHRAALDRSCRGVREWLSSMLIEQSTRGAVFDTRIESMRHLPGAARTGAKLARRHGLRVMGTEGFFVKGATGLLLDGELAGPRAGRSGW